MSTFIIHGPERKQTLPKKTISLFSNMLFFILLSVPGNATNDGSDISSLVFERASGQPKKMLLL